jgi:hypothetical protein
MKITALSQALRLVKRYSVSTRPCRFPKPGAVWFLRMDGVTFLTSKGKKITTNLFWPCRALETTLTGNDRQINASNATRSGQNQLANYLLHVFEKKHGFPGHRGWFQCVELVSVYDPIRRTIVHLDHRRAA